MKYKIFILLNVLLICKEYWAKCIPSKTTCSGFSAPKHVCSGHLIFEDNFDFLDFKKWQHEITLSGGGNWEFQWYTNNRSNSYATNGKLHITPTLTSDFIGEKNLYRRTIDISGNSPADLCTSASFWGCTRTGTPLNILNPIRSARIRTVNSFNFKYGRVEVKAKLPSGDWLWPAIWLLPTRNEYGGHPASGEIDIMEARGNKNLLLNGKDIGSKQVASTLHWGPDSSHNGYEKTHFELNVPKGEEGFDSGFSTYRMDWTPEYFNFYVDDVQIGSIHANESFWKFGGFDKTNMENPWRYGSKMAPFDQEFYIIINLAVGGVNGYFPDNADNVPPKPWLNTSPTSATDFWNGREGWLPTWNNGINSTFEIDYVKVWAL